MILQRILGAFPQARITPVVKQSTTAGTPMTKQRTKATFGGILLSRRFMNGVTIKK